MTIVMGVLYTTYWISASYDIFLLMIMETTTFREELQITLFREYTFISREEKKVLTRKYHLLIYKDVSGKKMT